MVVPHAGTWIEIVTRNKCGYWYTVVPHTGTWIEIKILDGQIKEKESFPTRERGLKL